MGIWKVNLSRYGLVEKGKGYESLVLFKGEIFGKNGILLDDFFGHYIFG